MITLDIQEVGTGTRDWDQLLQKLPVTLRRRTLDAGARAGANVVMENFAEREQQPNKNNWPKTHFYSQASKATNYKVLSDSDAEINISGPAGIGQRYRGGVINKKEHRLTIPAAPEFYGHRAGEFHNLVIKVLGRKNGKLVMALVTATATNIEFSKHKRKDGTRKITPTSTTLGGKVAYWLVNSVKQDPDPGVLPDIQELRAKVLQAGREEAARVLLEAQQGGAK